MGVLFCIVLELVASLGLQCSRPLQLQTIYLAICLCARQGSVLTPVNQHALHALTQDAAGPPRAYTLRDTFRFTYPPAPIHVTVAPIYPVPTVMRSFAPSAPVMSFACATC